MAPLHLHTFHSAASAAFSELNAMEIVAHYGDVPAEYAALNESVAVLDLSFRGRLCVLGEDRQRFLHGQVTQDVKRLRPNQGCYAALVNAKGKLESDLNLFSLSDEILLDFEPGLTTRVAERLEGFIIADDVQVVDVHTAYGLFGILGPRAAECLKLMSVPIPDQPFTLSTAKDSEWGEVYVINIPRLGTIGFDLYVPAAALESAAVALQSSVLALNGRFCGWTAFELARIERLIPRFGADMDESNLAPEAGLDERAISYSKGCYIGQEVIARIRTYGQVAKMLRGLRLSPDLTELPQKGDPLTKEGKPVGQITSAVFSPRLRAPIALGYVRREVNQLGSELTLRTALGNSSAVVAALPFSQNWT